MNAGSITTNGGNFRFPRAYSFVKRDNTQTSSKSRRDDAILRRSCWRAHTCAWLVHFTVAIEFNNNIQGFRDDGIEQRMPWLGARCGLLTTSGDNDGNWWGTLSKLVLCAERKKADMLPFESLARAEATRRCCAGCSAGAPSWGGRRRTQTRYTFPSDATLPSFPSQQLRHVQAGALVWLWTSGARQDLVLYARELSRVVWLLAVMLALRFCLLAHLLELDAEGLACNCLQTCLRCAPQYNFCRCGCCFFCVRYCIRSQDSGRGSSGTLPA